MAMTGLEIPTKAVGDFCQRWKISELALFGSALRPDFRPDSDVNVLVTFSSEAHWTLLDWVEMEQELATILGRPVDLISRRAVEQSTNLIRRRQILESAETIYGAR